MELQAALLCDYAQVRDGLLYVVGGGISAATALEFPAAIGAHLALVVLLTDDDLGRSIPIEAAVFGEMGRIGGIQADVASFGEGEFAVAPLVFPLSPIAIPAPGGYTVEVSYGTPVLVRLPLHVTIGG